MSGHSKWANIKHRKGAQDAKRSNIFSKISKDIIMAVKNGGSDPTMNIRLRAAIDKGRAANMPKDNIERAIKRGAGDLEGVNYESLIYEGYGPGGSAILVNVTTDNKNRAASDVRKFFTKFGGALGEPNCVAWMFDTKGYLLMENVEEDALMEAALEAGADDIIYDAATKTGEVYTLLEDYSKVSDALGKAGFIPISSEITQVPQNKIALDGEKTKSFLRLIDALEELDDVSSVSSNADLDEEAASAYEG